MIRYTFLALLFLSLIAGCVPVNPVEDSDNTNCVMFDLATSAELCARNGFYEDISIWYSEVFVRAEDGSEHVIEDLSGGFQVYDLIISADLKHIALLENAGEGHPFMSAFNIEGLIDHRKPRLVGTYEPYPGGVYDLEWGNDGRLYFTSDNNEMMYSYYLEPSSGKVIQHGKPQPLN